MRGERRCCVGWRHAALTNGSGTAERGNARLPHLKSRRHSCHISNEGRTQIIESFVQSAGIALTNELLRRPTVTNQDLPFILPALCNKGESGCYGQQESFLHCVPLDLSQPFIVNGQRSIVTEHTSTTILLLLLFQFYI